MMKLLIFLLKLNEKEKLFGHKINTIIRYKKKKKYYINWEFTMKKKW